MRSQKIGQRTSSSLPLTYLTLRLVRRFAPDTLVRALLRRGWIIRAGAETLYPTSSVNFYLKQLHRFRQDVTGKRILMFGYGGRFDVAIGLLESGATHVVLCDQLAEADHRHNAGLLPQYAQYLERCGSRIVPCPDHITLFHDDIRTARLTPVDIVFSNSVFEHLNDVAGTTRALARIMKSSGIQIHRIDLRDHYFKYPFEMLRFSSRVWENFLNPSSHHNRYRTWHYRRVFESCFDEVDIEVLHSDSEEFERIREYVKPEFISGDPSEDAATIILLVARRQSRL